MGLTTCLTGSEGRESEMRLEPERRDSETVPMCTMDLGLSSEGTVMWMEGSDGDVVSRLGERVGVGVFAGNASAASLDLSSSTRRKVAG